MLASQERLAQNDHNMEMTMLSSLLLEQMKIDII